MSYTNDKIRHLLRNTGFWHGFFSVFNPLGNKASLNRICDEVLSQDPRDDWYAIGNNLKVAMDKFQKSSLWQKN